jgi:tetratricopeptide (TPR) repeat protein
VVVALMTHTEGGTLRDDVGPWSTLLGMLVVFEEYLTKLFFPLNLNIWYPIPKYQSPLSGDVLAGILAVGAFIFLVRLIKKDKLIFFGLMWYVISLLPVSHIIPFPQMMADRFLYIPSIGLILAVVAGAQRIISSMGKTETGLARVLAVGVVLLFMSLNYHRSFVYENDFTLWEDSVKRHANNTVAVMYLGLTHWGKGDHDSALKYLQRAIEVNPKNIRAQVFMARILEEQKEFEQAIRIYENVIQQSPKTPSPYNHLAVLYGNQGKLGKAILLLEKAVGLDPEFGLAYFNLGVFQYQAGELENSLAAHQKAVEVEANNSQFHYQLGLFYLKNTDRGDLGRHHLEESLLLNPDRPDADKIRQMILKPS